MAKTRVDKIVGLMVQLEKSEVVELQRRMAEKHSVWVTIFVPADKLGGTITEGKLLKEADNP